MKPIILKGGSLNNTSIIQMEDGSRRVRKSIDRHNNREYGFVRWYSQMKRLQRYGKLFPGLFPELLDVGVERETAYFDIAYFAEAIDLKCWLTRNEPSQEMIIRVHNQLWEAMAIIHGTHMMSSRNALALYFAEEVEQKLTVACQNEEFRAFTRYYTLEYCGEPCVSLIHNMEWYKRQFTRQTVSWECFTHGNITLENVLYDTASQRILFIDPYDENVVDCIENEYSQILQCSKNYYGFLNDLAVHVVGDRAFHHHTIPDALRQFDQLFRTRMSGLLQPETQHLVSLFEISQFVRMLPFKVATGNLLHAKFFYALASKLTHSLMQNYQIDFP